ncbi:hypothetical protein CL619_00235 [archaeon]|nr:hypothetical protein [archaeon]
MNPGLERILKSIRGVKKLKEVDIPSVRSEVIDITQYLNPKQDEVRSYRPHKVTVKGVDYIACDAKSINRQMNQRGRGDYRHLFTPQGEYVGIAVHAHKGYKKVA